MADTLITGTTLVEKESRSIGDVPIGGIVSWLKNFTGVPNLAEGWVECDGSTIADALSPLNGQTLPNLNGNNNFLRGNSTSGGTGGATTQEPNLGKGISAGVDNAVTTNKQMTSSIGGADFLAADVDRSGGTGVEHFFVENRTEPFSIEPPYYEVVWIMRVR